MRQKHLQFKKRLLAVVLFLCSISFAGYSQADTVSTVAELQTAISNNSAHIVLRDGQYILSSPLTFTDHIITLEGETKWGAEIIGTNISAGPVLMVNGAGSYLECVNLKIIANEACINLDGNAATIDYCYFVTSQDNAGYALNSVTGNSYLTIRNSVFDVKNGAVSIDLTKSDTYFTFSFNTVKFNTSNSESDAIVLAGYYYDISSNIFDGAALPLTVEPGGSIMYNLITVPLADLDPSNLVDASPMFAAFPNLDSNSPCIGKGFNSYDIGAVQYVAPICDLKIEKIDLGPTYRFFAIQSGYTNITGYNWTFKLNGVVNYLVKNDSTGSVTFPLPSAGDWNVTLEILASGCSNYVAYFDTTVAAPACDLRIDTTMITLNKISFTPIATGYTSIEAYNWTISKYGETIATSTATTFDYTFPSEGLYDISLIISASGCINYSTTQEIFVYTPPCIAIGTFTVATSDSISGKVVFNIAATDADTVIIDYYDGNYDTLKYTGATTVTHIFEPGLHYGINAIFYNSTNKCSSEIPLGRPIMIYDKNCNIEFSNYYTEPFLYSFNFYNGNQIVEPNVAVSVKFSDKTVQSFSLDQITYMYDFSHKFTKAGYDTIIITSKGNVCQSTDTVEIYVKGAECTYPILSKVKDAGNNYNFTISGASKGSFYVWEISNGNIDTTFTTADSLLNYTFKEDGFYNIYVYSSDVLNDCESGWLYDYVIIGSLNCYSSFSLGRDSMTFEFYNYSIENKTYKWDFGDGTIDTSYYPKNHTYKVPGIYKVTLTVYDKATNCLSSFSKEAVAGNVSCHADFSINVNGLDVTFNNKSTGNQWTYWYFGDYGWSEQRNPVHKYEQPGFYDVYLSIDNDAGCHEEFTKRIQVGDVKDQVFAEFYYYVGDDNKTVNFTNASTKNVTNWSWTFGQGSFSNDTNPKLVYTTPGLYDVCLTVSNKIGATNTNCYQVAIGTVLCNAQAEFSYRVDTTTNTIKCINKSKGDIDFYYWDFGDGSTSNDSAPKAHKYDKPGYYYVSLSVQKWDSWCSDYYYEYVQVGQMPCIAKFDFTVDAAKKTVNFANKSKGITAEYYWWFDDGTNSTDKDPVKVFDYNGLHYAGLTVISDNGECWDYTEKEIQVGEIECSAKFTYYVDKATNKAFCQNKAIGSNVEYYWMFGDGAESTDTNPVHKFDYPGYYTISLNTFDANTWCMDYFEEVVLVGEEGIDCAADFIYTIDNAKQEVTFKDNSKGTIVDYIWDFGDGEWDDKAKTTHKYNVGGYYNVCLNVWNNKGIPNITCKQIKVAATAKTDCQAKFAFSVDTAKKTVTFFNKSLGKPTGFEWNFGDGSATKKVAKPDTSHKYTKADYYLASLVITTDSGCKSSAYKLVNVNMPDTGFVVRFGSESRPYDKKAGGYPIDFIGAGLGDQAKLKWAFGDDSTNTTSNTPTHVYDDASTPYTVCLTYADPVTGDSATHCEEVTTAKLCESDQMKPTAICKAYTLVLDAAGTGTLKISDVDNKSADDCGAVTLALSKTSFTTADLGAKKVTLTATDPSGNKATCEANITVTANDAINSAVMVSGLEVYPNPFNDKITVSYNLLDNSTVDITIYDMVGKKVTSLSSTKLMSGLQTTQYDVSGLQSGGYILQVRTSNGVVKKQMIMKK